MPVTFQHATLDNGLTIIAETDPGAHSAAIGYFVKTGARDEALGVMGVSHFLEHMMFKGTQRRTAEDINRGFDAIGAKNNAYTSHEMTCFYASVLPDRLFGAGGANDLLADMMRPALRQTDFDTEKNVILEEIAMYDDNPFFVLYERTLEEHHAGAGVAGGAGMHPLGHRVLGTKSSITDLSSEQMRDYFERRYSADNTVVAIAGKVDFGRAVEEIGERCGSWRRTGAARTPGAAQKRDRDLELRDEKVNRAYALMLTPGPSSTDPRRYAASLLSQIVGGSDNSRLHWALIDPGLADQAEMSLDTHDGSGDYMLFVTCDPDKAGKVWSIVEAQLADLDRTLCEDDLSKIRSKAATGVVLAGERPGGRMQRLGRQWLYHGAYTTLEEELERINRVSVGDVRGVLRDFPLRPRTLGWLLPKAV